MTSSDQHAGQKGLESTPRLVPMPQLPVEGAALAGCLSPGREVKPGRCSTCDPSSPPPTPSPVPSCKEIHTPGGCLRCRLSSARPVAAFPGGGGSRDLGWPLGTAMALTPRASSSRRRWTQVLPSCCLAGSSHAFMLR